MDVRRSLSAGAGGPAELISRVIYNYQPQGIRPRFGLSELDKRGRQSGNITEGSC